MSAMNLHTVICHVYRELGDYHIPMLSLNILDELGLYWQMYGLNLKSSKCSDEV